MTEENGYGDFTSEELEAEKAEIDQIYASLKFAQKVRHTTISCFKMCGGNPMFPFTVDPDALAGKNLHCFGDCLNVKFEKGPFLNELGDIPDDSIPKKFIWPHGISHQV